MVMILCGIDHFLRAEITCCKLRPQDGRRSTSGEVGLIFAGWVAGDAARGDVKDVLLAVFLLCLSPVMALVTGPISRFAWVTASADSFCIFVIYREGVILDLHT